MSLYTVCVCVYYSIYIYIYCIYIHTHCIYIYIYIYIHTHTYMCIYIYTVYTHTHTRTHARTHAHTHTHTHSHTHVCFCELWGHSIGVMVFIQYKPYFLSPYTNPTPKPTPYRKLCAVLLSQKKAFCMIYKPFEILGTWGNVLIRHLLLVIPMSYPCHYTNLCPHK